MSRRRCPDNHPWMLDLGEGVTVLCGALRRSDAARLRARLYDQFGHSPRLTRGEFGSDTSHMSAVARGDGTFRLEKFNPRRKGWRQQGRLIVLADAAAGRDEAALKLVLTLRDQVDVPVRQRDGLPGMGLSGAAKKRRIALPRAARRTLPGWIGPRRLKLYTSHVGGANQNHNGQVRAQLFDREGKPITPKVAPKQPSRYQIRTSDLRRSLLPASRFYRQRPDGTIEVTEPLRKRVAKQVAESVFEVAKAATAAGVGVFTGNMLATEAILNTYDMWDLAQDRRTDDSYAKMESLVRSEIYVVSTASTLMGYWQPITQYSAGQFLQAAVFTGSSLLATTIIRLMNDNLGPKFEAEEQELRRNVTMRLDLTPAASQKDLEGLSDKERVIGQLVRDTDYDTRLRWIRAPATQSKPVDTHGNRTR